MIIIFLVLTLLLLLAFYTYMSQFSATQSMHNQAYILHTHVTHARLLPYASRHAFSYPTLNLLVSLRALESRSLDIPLLFRYASRAALTSIQAASYLSPSHPGTIMQKLRAVVEQHGVDAQKVIYNAWMLTMPAFLGWAGINPLTVYFCYTMEGAFWGAVLEIHNTFGESHVHVLQAGISEDVTPDSGYDYQWTFPRAFHVSPFNDREGYYTVSLAVPSQPPSPGFPSSSYPFPSIRVHLHTPSASSPSTPGPLKLTASVRPYPDGVRPLTRQGLLLALVRAPLALVLTFPRIVWQAAILHYQKRLDVFPRPEPFAVVSSSDSLTSLSSTSKPSSPGRSPSSPNHGGHVKGGGVRWQPEGALERHARQRVESFLSRRACETATFVEIVSGSDARTMLQPKGATFTRGKDKHLTIMHLSPRFYTTLFLAPTAAHSLLLASSEHEFTVSSDALFLDLFSYHPEPSTRPPSLGQRLRASVLPPSLDLPVPATHSLDVSFLDICVVTMLIVLSRLEPIVFNLTGARFVLGTEPWGVWERAATVSRAEKAAPELGGWLGSVRREG